MHLRALGPAVLGLAAAATGCGLVDPDITNFNLALPDKTFTVDASNWGLMNADQLLTQSCTVSPDPCAAAAQQACAQDACIGQCDPNTLTCNLTLFVSLFNEVDLINEKPELQTIDDQPLIDVTVDDIQYEVTVNSLNVATPEMVVYAAPSTVMSPDPRAKRIGVVPSVPAGALVPQTGLVFDADGKANLAEFMSMYKVPFNIIVGSQIELGQGDMIPTGAMAVRVSVAAHAGL